MKYRPSNTLAHFNAAPQTHIHDLSVLPTSVFAEATKAYRVSCGVTSPNDEAVTFYTLNHAASLVRKSFTLNEPLPFWAQSIMLAYTHEAVVQGERLLHYLLCITTRETRHLKSCSDQFWNKVKKQWGPSSVQLLQNISSNGDEFVAMEKYISQPPDIPIGQYVKTISYGFHHGNYAGSYGGKPWGDTTDALVDMIHGVTSMEMLVDTGYTLAHNGGPIFDKNMMYSSHDSNLLTVLDVQRSSQMPDLMLASETMGIKKTPQAVTVALLLKEHRPEALKGYVDWKLVDDLRPEKDKHSTPSKYAKMIAHQKPMTTKKIKIPAVKVTPVTLGGKVVKAVGPWQVYPGQTVTAYERVK